MFQIRKSFSSGSQVFQKPRLVDWKMIGEVEHLPRGTIHADWLDTIVVALDLVHSCG